ncbi:hypothetical protein M0657_002231 [Pyricularia oryzae]|uniref:V-type proton ATPase subunit G n=1 Tax=Pyricularia oryzae TaxID=318829 RepID=A0A4P7NND3_PYROR|nr:hypothetical protein M9X92_008283 [Pyricularia oryzae]KAI7929256.1 hypothetical protein M0657_002231 [Pyricularia oryzae]QBZ63669.1 hypothetical protein PoMZ_05355 [Pyricularia oryzae]
MVRRMQSPTAASTVAKETPKLTIRFPTVCSKFSGYSDPARVRTKRVKEARDEAKKEIEAYKAEKEGEYKAFESKHTQGNKQAEEEANKEAETEIKEIKEAGKKHQDKVIKDLLKAVFEPHPVPPTAA